MSATTDGTEAVGIFAYVKGGSTIQNFIIDSSCEFQSRRYAGAIGAVSGGSGEVTVSGIVNHGSVTAKRLSTDQPGGDPRGQNAAGIIGVVLTDGIPVSIIDCGVTGPVTGDCESAAICGWFRDGQPNLMKRCWSTATITGVDGTKGMYRGTLPTIEDCYGNGNALTLPDDYKKLLVAAGGAWCLNDEGELIVEMDQLDVSKYEEYVQELNLDRKYGTVATFFYPRDPYSTDGIHPGLQKEYIIAADFSQKFNVDNNLEVNKIIEPAIVYRHLFRIRDGKQFAEDMSGSPEKNRDYVRANLRHISARANTKFQIRLDSPLPKKGTEQVVRSKYYYKISPTDYRRICSARIRVLNMDNGQEIENHPFRFADDKDENGKYIGEGFDGQGSRVIDGITYYACGGGGRYYRFIKADKVDPGRYTVQLLAEDYNGNLVHPYVPDGKCEEPLIIQEFRMTFLPNPGAFMIPMAELDKEGSAYAAYTEEKLKESFGEPTAKVDFDEYRIFAEKADNDYMLYRNTDNVERWQFKWPVPWGQSNYGFGYDAFYDYNMYRISTHSLETPYRALADLREPSSNHGKGYGMYDRLFYRTKGNDTGFFYYVNGATDPGIMAVLKIDDLCSGSTLNVSAFVSEFSKTTEVANIAFNFVARKKDGTRVPIHSFVSGYVPKPGEDPKLGLEEKKYADWFNIYYSFVPNFSGLGLTTADVDHYELELDNNCKSSSGADYAIDDIRVYVVRPQVTAKQITPLCNSEKSTEVMITTPFDVMLQTLGHVRATSETAGQTVDLFYTILDKEAYDKARSEGKDGTEAYEAAVLKYDYMDSQEQGSEPQSYGSLQFSTYFDSDSHKPYADGWNDRKPNVVMKRSQDGTDYLCFLVKPYDTKMKSGKEYLIALCADLNGEHAITVPGASDFDLENNCSKTCVFRVQASGTIKINGVVVPDATEITCCENQQPVVQINLKGKEITKDGETETVEMVDVESNAHFDWYKGSRQEFDEEISEDGIKLIDALTQFRIEYDKEETAYVDAPKGDFTEGMRDYLLKMTMPVDGVAPKLELYKSSYVFPPLKTEEGENEKDEVVTAIPIDRLNQSGGTANRDTIICSEPAEVRIHVLKRAPSILHGLSIKYPGYITDVPLRVGLNQLARVKSGNSEGNTLNIPLRLSESTLESVKSMVLSEDRSLYLAATNDLAYKDLCLKDESGKEDENAGSSEDGTGLTPFGEITELVAKVGENIPGNILRVVFDKDFKFKESYYYTFLFHYEEDLKNAEGKIDTDNLPCEGDHVFTLKIAPEYAMWTAEGGNHNWNNDRNWRRVSSRELNAVSAEGREDFVTDGNNKEISRCYMPLYFTKVIIPRGEKYPYLYVASESRDVTVEDGDDTFTASWPANPEDKEAGSPAGTPEGILDLLKVGTTPDIHYDMVGRISDKGINCRPWYMHTCDKIHFHSGSRLFSQQELKYNYAWVDLELEPQRWYTLSSPLKGVVAGDMYLPKSNARQTSELFKDITYNPDLNNRFAPAVFQRSWNKASAIVYEIKNGPKRDVAVAADWSNVYNDVTESYPAGGGFSVKTDVSAMPDDSKPAGKVMFRLPKADTSFSYYSEDGITVGNDTVITRPDGYGKLNDTHGTVIVSGKKAGKYFLVGNPFMTDMIMEKFLEENKDKINPKYWILTADTRTASIFDETDGLWISAGYNDDGSVKYDGAGRIAPMQGFFVEAKEDTESLSLTYNESMMSKDVNVDGLPVLRSRGYDPEFEGMYISAVTDGIVRSTAVLRLSPDASKEYSPREDVKLFYSDTDREETVVYTLAGQFAISVNTVPDLENVEVGFVDNSDEGSVIRFENVGMGAEYMLYDTSGNEYTPITEGLEYEMPSDPGARLIIKSADSEIELNGIEVCLRGNEMKVSTTRDRLDIRVYDTMGRLVDSLSEASPEAAMTLDKGIFIVDISDGVDKKTIKIVI